MEVRDLVPYVQVVGGIVPILLFLGVVLKPVRMWLADKFGDLFAFGIREAVLELNETVKANHDEAMSSVAKTNKSLESSAKTLARVNQRLSAHERKDYELAHGKGKK